MHRSLYCDPIRLEFGMDGRFIYICDLRYSDRPIISKSGNLIRRYRFFDQKWRIATSAMIRFSRSLRSWIDIIIYYILRKETKSFGLEMSDPDISYCPK